MPDMWMDVDAALAEVPINLLALIDDGDFKAREESVTYDQAGLDLLWNFVTTAGAMAQTAVTPTDTAGDYDWVNQGNGLYTIEIPATGGASANNDTEGFGWFTGFATGILPWRGPVIGFRAAGLNNALIDGAYSATRGLAGTALPAVAANGAGGLVTSAGGSTGIDDLATPTNITAGTITTVTTLTGHTAQTGDSFARIGAAGSGLTNINLPNQTMDIIGNITGDLSGSVGSVTGAVGSVAGHTPQTGDTFALANGASGFVATKAETTLIVGDTNELQIDWTDGGRLDNLLDAIPTTAMRGTDGALTDKAGFSLSTAGILAIWHQLTSAIVTASTIGKLLVDNINATISSRHASGAAVASVSGNVDGSVGSLAAQAKTDVNAEVVDVLVTDTYAEVSAVPAATSSIINKLGWLFTLSRNKGTQTSTTKTLRNDADDGDIATSAISADDTTFTRGRWS